MHYWTSADLQKQTGVMPNKSHCQITSSARFARQVGLLNLTLQLTLTLTEEINK